MKESKPLTKGELNKMIESHFVTLKPNEKNPRIQNVNIDIGFYYTGLMGKIESLISVTMSAIHAKEETNVSFHSDNDLIEVLGIAKELIPYPEIGFIDNLYERFVIPKASSTV